MTEPTITYGHGLLQDFKSDFLFKDSVVYVADGAGAVGTTTDATLTEANDYWNGCFIKFTSGDNVGLTREITDFDAATDTLTHDVFPQGCADDDTFLLSAWQIIEDGQTLDTPTTDGDTVSVIASASAGNEAGYLVNFTNLSLSTSIYTKLCYRYKTSDANVKAKIVAEFSDASTQEILADASSLTWVYGSTTLTTAKTLDHIRLHADHATGTVYYDFALVCAGTFTFPNSETIDVEPATDLVRTAYPSRIGRVPQTMGADDTKLTLVCDLDIGDWTRTGDTIQGQVFFDISHNGSISEDWQWLTTGQGTNFKARLEKPHFIYGGNRHLLNLTLYECRTGSADGETYKERFGIT